VITDHSTLSPHARPAISPLKTTTSHSMARGFHFPAHAVTERPVDSGKPGTAGRWEAACGVVS